MRKVALFAAAFLVFAGGAAHSQNTDIESLAGITFNFANPGARSMGMGGAFLGLADDASAAEANPAGLTVLQKPEVSIEARHWRNASELTVSGIFPNFETQEFSSFGRAAEVTFGSVVIPAGNFAFAAYYHQPLNFENSAAVLPDTDRLGNAIPGSVPRFFFTPGNPIGSGTALPRAECEALPQGQCFFVDVLPFVTAVQMKMRTIGLAGAVELGTLSLGATARYHEFEEAAFTTRFFEGALHSIAVQATQLEGNEAGTEDDFTWAAGFKWTPTQRFSVGGVYKVGPEFPAPTFVLQPDVADEFRQVAATNFHVPDVAGLGISFRPVTALTINVDAVNITYSNLVDDFQTDTTGIVRFENGERIVILEEPFEAEDVTEIHVGAEYFFGTRIPFALRAGWWRDPAHSLTYSGPLTCTDAVVPTEERILCSVNRITESILFPEGEDLDHFSIGIGLAFQNFLIDAAYDTSDRFKVGSLSAVYRF